MKSELQVELLLPQGVMAGALQADASALSELLRCAQPLARSAGDEQAWLCRRFEVAQQQDWPLAPFACVGDGLVAGGDYWLCADPVHLLLLRDSFSVVDADALDAAQAQRLVDALNAHFGQDGLQFFAARPDRWYLRLAQAPRLHTTPLAQVLGRDLQKLLPQGEDAMQWHARLNEMQMLLHGHALNVELEQQGRLPVNSLWLWGGGVHPGRCTPQPLHAWTHDAAVCGLALAHGGSAAALPASAAQWLRQAGTGRHLLVLDGARREQPLAAWQRLQADWLVPLLPALRAGALASLALHLAHGGRVHSYLLRRTDLRKFWRRSRSLGVYLG